MDNHRVARAARVDAQPRLTRHCFCRLFVAALGTALGLGSVANVTAARCRKKSARCSRMEQCCSKRCKRGFCYPRRR